MQVRGVAIFVVPLAFLVGCAGSTLDSECWKQGQQTCQQDPRYGLVTQDGRAITPEGKAKQDREEEERRRRMEEGRKMAIKRAEQERLQREYIAKQEIEHQQEKAQRVAADEARGYKHTSLDDLYLDRKTMPLGTKRAVTGVYQVFGDLETLSHIPLESPLASTPHVFLITGSAPREVRRKLLQPQCRMALCGVTVLGHTESCAITWASSTVRREVCLSVDEIW